MLKLRRLRIEKFRGVTPGTELRFSDGINVLLGQNGTGKTTLLELISMIIRSDFSSLAREAFAIEYELTIPGEATAVVAVSNEDQTSLKLMNPPQPRGMVNVADFFRPAAQITVEDLVSGNRRRVRYDTEGGLTIAGDGQPPIEGDHDFTCLDAGFLWLCMQEDPALVANFTYRVLRASSVLRLDESLDMFGRFTGGGDSREMAIYHGVGRLFSLPSKSLRLPDVLVEKLATMYERTKSDYVFTHVELDFLGTLKEIMGFDSAELKVEVTERHPWGDKGEKVILGDLVFRFWWEDGEFITHARLSYGQKRLLAFFYYLACNDDVVIADELVNGLHHHWITACVEALGERQAFLTSQNPLLLDYIPITSSEQVQRTFVLCRSQRRDGRQGWVWENMSEQDAAELFAAYEVGIEHVSEILQSRGLW